MERFYNPPGLKNHDLEELDATNHELEPGFLAYDERGVPVDWHLALTSALINAGSPDRRDVDGTVADPGAYGGESILSRDLDGDGFPDYFWPGQLADAPAGFDPTDYDCLDLNEAIQACPP